jgi:hypothetical protein
MTKPRLVASPFNIRYSNSVGMYKLICLSLLGLAQCALAHGGHENAGPQPGETIQQYAQRHVHQFLNVL